MKNLIFILGVAISLSMLNGCGDSDSFIDPGPGIDPGSEIPIDDIVGNWQMTKKVTDGLNITDDCNTQSFFSILETKTFSGKDYELVQNDCILTWSSGGSWEPLVSNEYTFSIFGNEFMAKLNGDTLKTEYIHPNDGIHYMFEYFREP